MNTRLCSSVMLCIVFLAACGLVRAADWVVPAFNGNAIGFGNYSSIAHYAAKHKVYVGILTDSIQRKGLLVYDTDSTGKIIGQGRQYLSHPDPEPAGKITWVTSILVDTRHNKLFLGLNPQDAALTTPLVMYSLDANGEPIGTPTAYATGHPYKLVESMVLHPTLNRLYTVGWGGPGIYMVDLDANGVPTGALSSSAVGGYGKYSVSIRGDGSKLYLGTYPGVLEVIDLDAAGSKTGSVRSYNATGFGSWYLEMTANAKGVYYTTSDGYLAYWALSSGEPSGDPVIDAGHPVFAVSARAGGTLVAAEKVQFTDAIDLSTKTGGMRVREYSLNANGSINAVVNDTGSLAFDRQEVYSGLLVGDPNPVVATKWLSGFLGNRFANLSIRTTLESATASGSFTPYFTSTSMSSYGAYLRFAYSARYNKVYTADGSNINIYNLTTGVKEANVPCASSTQVMVVDDQNGDGYLYVALSTGNVDRRPLTTAGIPAEEADVITTGAGSIGAMALNAGVPNRYVYLCCSGGTAGTIAGTNLVRLPGSSYFTKAIVDPAKGRLYAGNSYHANSNLAVWRLNTDGSYNAGPTWYSDGAPIYGTLRGFVSGLALNSAKAKLYLSASPEANQGAGTGSLVTYALDANGDPTTSSRIALANIQGASGPLALLNDGTKLFEAGWGDATIYLRSLDAEGMPTATVIPYAIGQYGKSSQLMLTATNDRLLAGSYPSVLETIALNPDGTGALAATAKLVVKSQTFNFGQLAPGMSSAWMNLDNALKGWSGSTLGALTLTGATLTQARVKFEFSLDGGATILTSGATNLDGNTAELFLPGYGVTAMQLADLASWIRTSSQFYSWCLAQIPPDAGANRPRQFVVANLLFAAESSPESANLAYQMMAAMGHNTMGGWGGAKPAAMHEKALANGIDRFKWAVYNPPSYFDFYPEFFGPGYQDDWAAGFAPELANMFGATPDELALFHMADEPGWYFPGVLDSLNDAAHPERVAVFRAYLQGKELTPATFGETSWNDVYAIGLSAATTLPKMKLYYWTARFYAESLSNAFAASTAALRRQLNPDLLTTTNLNNWPGRFFIPSPNVAIANNPIVGPDSAMGMPDWNDLGRKNAVSCIWTEDWFSDQNAQGWSIYGDLLRCAAREGTGIEYGAYVVGQPLGAFPDGSGGEYKVMALVGHGAKALDGYCFGPNEIFGDGWSPSVRAYKPFTDAFHLLGQCEKVLYPGRPRNGTVAILVPKASQVWDGDANAKQYLTEIYGLHYALTHQQYPVDYIDDYDIEQGALTTFGYKTLYVTAPNLSVAAQTAIRNWVNTGGTLALFPGACRYDEYNQSTTILTSVVGAAWPDTVTRANQSSLGFRSPRVLITVTDATTLQATADVTPTQIAPLTLSTATALATMDGGAAVTRQTYGAGRIFAYGYYPGLTYSVLVNAQDQTRLPLDWRGETRNIITAPARAGATPAARFVTVNADLVEAALLESKDAGIGITLLNWSGSPLPSITVRIDKATMPAAVLQEINDAMGRGALTVTSAKQGALAFTNNLDDIEITLPLATVDVLMLVPPPNVPPTVRLTAPTDGTVYDTPPASITLTADASDIDGTVTQVEFYQGTTLLGTDTTAPYSFTWTPVPAGNYVLTAVATDNDGASATSDPVNIQVKAVIALTLTADAANTALVGSAQRFNAFLSGIDNPEYAFGVTLRDIQPDGSIITQTIIPMPTTYGPTASLSFTPADPGRYTITVYARAQGTVTPRYIKSIAYNVGTPTLTGITALATNRPSGTAMDAVPVSGIKLSATITGTGVGAQYFFSAVLKDGQADGSTVDVPVTMSTAWGANAYYWHPTEPGTYLLTVQARDATCNISYSKTITFLLRATELKSLSSIGFTPPYGTALNKLPASGILLRAYIVGTGTGNEYLFTGRLRVTNPDGSITYVPVEMGTAWQVSRDYYWHPAEPGVYNIIVYGRDATYNTSLYKSITYLVKPPL